MKWYYVCFVVRGGGRDMNIYVLKKKKRWNDLGGNNQEEISWGAKLYQPDNMSNTFKPFLTGS